MNAAYRKQRRLKTRHARQGHTPLCNCPEEFQRMMHQMRRRLAALTLIAALNDKTKNEPEEEWIGDCPCGGNDIDCLDDDRNWKPIKTPKEAEPE